MCEFERDLKAREIYPSLDQMNKVRSKDSKGFFGRNRKFKRFFAGDLQKQKRSSPNLQGIFRPKTGDLQKKEKVFSKFARDFSAEIRNSSGFSGRKWVISEKRSSSQKCHDIRCQSTKNTNLGVDLHSSSPEPVTFFVAQSSLGEGHKQSFRGSTARYAPRGAGSATLYHRRQMMYCSCSSCIGCIIHIIIDHSAHHNEVYYEARP